VRGKGEKDKERRDGEGGQLPLVAHECTMREYSKGLIDIEAAVARRFDIREKVFLPRKCQSLSVMDMPAKKPFFFGCY